MSDAKFHNESTKTVRRRPWTERFLGLTALGCGLVYFFGSLLVPDDRFWEVEVVILLVGGLLSGVSFLIEKKRDVKVGTNSSYFIR